MRRLFLAILFFLLTSTSLASAQETDKLFKEGMSGSEISIIQKILADGGYYLGSVDGEFGSSTVEAVMNFQIYNDLLSDGVVGKETMAYLKRGVSIEISRFHRSISLLATAYTRFDDGCGDYTYNGNYLRKGMVAVDPAVIPLGTRLYIPGYGFAVADDIGGAIKGNRIDLAFDTRDEALTFGRQHLTVYFVE